MSTLEELVASLIAAREERESARITLHAEITRLNEQIAPLIQARENMETAVVKLEADVRAEIIRAYYETGSKSPLPGLGVRVTRKLVYHPNDALRWAKEHDLALALDKPAFEKIAKATPFDTPFVRLVEEATATISPTLTAEEVAADVPPSE